MNVKNFMDSNMEKGVHDIVFVTENGEVIKGKNLDYETSEVVSVDYKKIAVIKVKGELIENS